jgi:hypothetical protein
MNRTLPVLIALLLLSFGCKGVGFRDTEDARHHVSVQIAREVLVQVQDAITSFHTINHRYPLTNEVHLYDSIHSYFKDALDPAQLYRNDGGKGFYIAIGSRANKLVYRYPPTVGSMEYTLYWVGPNSVDEEGEGDDLVAWDTSGSNSHFQRRKLVDLRGDNHPVELNVVESGSNIFRDSVKLQIKIGDSILYSERWPLNAYIVRRPELTDDERKRIVREELSRLLNPSEFVQTDSLVQQDWRQWADLKPKSPEAAEIMKRNLLMFNFYKGAAGSEGIVWSPTRKMFIKVWKSV